MVDTYGTDKAVTSIIIPEGNMDYPYENFVGVGSLPELVGNRHILFYGDKNI